MAEEAPSPNLENNFKSKYGGLNCYTNASIFSTSELALELKCCARMCRTSLKIRFPIGEHFQFPIRQKREITRSTVGCTVAHSLTAVFITIGGFFFVWRYSDIFMSRYLAFRVGF
jgi:hypothetical protein